MTHNPRRLHSSRPNVLHAVLVLCIGLSGREAAATVQATGELVTPRWGHSATFVGTGRVLVAGGWGASGRLSSAELFDPSTGVFMPTGSMPETRNGHTATVLRSGKVLVVGGWGASGTLATCALYDPGAGTWTSTGSLGTPRREHTATLLDDGKVLVTGGLNVLSPLSNAELFDPATGTWQGTGAMSTARSGHAAAVLPDGRVLVAGGQKQAVPAEYTRSAELFTPSSGSWTSTGQMATARRSHTLTLLPTGLVVAAGGRNSATLSDTERYSIAGGTWGAAGDLPEARTGHGAALLPDGRILLSGGSGSGGALATQAEYDPVANAWVDVEPGVARTAHTVTVLPGGRVLVAGGLDAEGAFLAGAQLVDRMNPEWSNAGTVWGRASGTATLLPNVKVLILGKVSSGDATRGSLYTPGSGSAWSFTAGTMVVPRSNHTATLLADGRVLIAGGYDLNGDLATTDEIYDPATETFTATPGLPAADRLADHNAILLADGRVFVAGRETSGPSRFRVWAPSTATWSAAGTPPDLYGAGVRPTLLANGQVLVVDTFEDAYLYDPGPGGGWQATGKKGDDRYVVDTVLLPSGDVLVCHLWMNYSLYDVKTRTFQTPFPAASFSPRSQSRFQATLLPDGRVLLTGGLGGNGGGEPMRMAAVLDPATGVTTPLAEMAATRSRHDALLLTSGHVLVAGGFVDMWETTMEPSVEILALWPDMADSFRPFVSTWSTSIVQPTSFTLGGTGFRGPSEGSGGNGGASSPTGHPAVLLRRIEGGLMRWAASSSAGSWTTTSFPSETMSGLPAGRYAVTLFASGIPAFSRIVSVTPCELSTGALASTPAASVCQGQPLVLTAKEIAGATYLWTLPDGSTASGQILTIPGAQPDDSGVYSVVATKGGCPSPRDAVTVRVAPYPESIEIDAPSEVRGDQTYRATVPERLGATYEWTLSGGTLYYGQGESRISFRTPNVAGSMTISVVETVGATCTQPEAEKQLVVGPGLYPQHDDPIVVGASNTFPGGGFLPGSVLKMFVSTAGGPVDTNPAGWPPTSRTATSLTWEIPPDVPLGQGFATLYVVNTDQGYRESNVLALHVFGSAEAGIPTIQDLNGSALKEPDASIPGAHVERVLAAGSTVAIGGTGFNAPLVNLFTSSGNLGPLTPLPGGTATSFQVVVPSNVPAGPGTFQVVNTGTGYKLSNAVDAVLRARITVTSVSVSGSTVNVVGDGFCALTVINLFNAQGGGVVNLGGLSGAVPVIPLTVTDAQHFSFTLPAGAQSGPAYVQALNPPFTPYTASGTDPGGAFTIP